MIPPAISVELQNLRRAFFVLFFILIYSLSLSLIVKVVILCEEIILRNTNEKSDIMEKYKHKKSLNMARVEFLTSLYFTDSYNYFYKIFSVFFMMQKCMANSITFIQVMNTVTNKNKNLLIKVTNEICFHKD